MKSLSSIKSQLNVQNTSQTGNICVKVCKKNEKFITTSGFFFYFIDIFVHNSLLRKQGDNPSHDMNATDHKIFCSSHETGTTDDCFIKRYFNCLSHRVILWILCIFCRYTNRCHSRGLSCPSHIPHMTPVQGQIRLYKGINDGPVVG